MPFSLLIPESFLRRAPEWLDGFAVGVDAELRDPSTAEEVGGTFLQN